MKRILRKLILFLLLLALCLPSVKAKADDADDLEQEAADLEQEADDLENEADGVDADIEELERQKREEEERAAYYQGLYDALDEQMGPVYAAMDEILDELIEIDRQVAEVNRDVLDLEKEEEDTAAAIEAQKKAMAKRIQYMYEQQTSSFWEVLTGASSMGAILNSADYMASVSAYDQQMLAEYKANLEKVKICREESLKKQKEILALQDSTVERKADVMAKADAILADMDAYETEIDEAGEKAAEYARDISEMRERAEALREAARVAAEEAAWRAAQAEEERLAAEEAWRIAQEEAEREAREAAEEAERQAREAASMEASDARGIGSVDISGDWYNPSGYTNLELLAGILECECGSQTWEGQVAVGNVIYNRILDPHFQMTIYDVIYGPGQFTPTWTGTLDMVMARGPKDLCMSIAQDIIDGARVLGYEYLYFCSPNSWINNPKHYTDYTFICYHYFYY